MSKIGKRLLSIALVTIFSAVAAHADFVTVSTSFGPQSALRDNATQLDWLHLNFTRTIPTTPCSSTPVGRNL